MKTILRLSVLFLCVVCASLVCASDRTGSDAPQITVKKKSNFVTPGEFPYLFIVNSALNTGTGENLVIWQFDEGTGNFVRGRIVSAKGQATGKKIATIPQDHYQMGNSVAYNQAKNEYLIAYPNLGGIYGQRIDSKLKRIGNEFEIITATLENTNLYPHVLFNAKTNGYALIWERTEGIAAVMLDSSGKVTSSMVLIFRNPGQNGYYDDSACPTCGSEGRVFEAKFIPSGKLLVIFQQRFNDNSGDYFLATLDSNLSSLVITKFNTNTVDFTNKTPFNIGRFGYLASLAVLPDGSAVIYFADHKSVKSRKIDSKGKLGQVSPAFSGSLKTTALWDPSVAFATTSNGTTVGLLIATKGDPNSDFSNSIWGQVLDSAGRPKGEPVLLETLGENTAVFGSDLIPLKQSASSSALPFLFFQSQVHREKIGSLQFNDDGYLIQTDLEIHP